MKNIYIAFTSLIILASCQSTKSVNKASNDPSNVVVSTYKDGNVTLKDVNAEIDKLVAKNSNLKGITFDKLNKDQKESLVKEFVLNEYIYNAAKKRKLDRDADYKDALKIFEIELLKQKLFIDLAKEASKEENVKKNYDEIAAKLKDKKDIRISYIAVKTQKEAQALYNSLTKYPASFAAVAKKRSIDKDVAAKGGDLGFVVEDVLPAEVVKQARAAGKGKVSLPVFAMEKWIVAKLEDERPAEILSFEKSKDTLSKNLAKKAIEDFLKKSLEEAKISSQIK